MTISSSDKFPDICFVPLSSKRRRFFWVFFAFLLGVMLLSGNPFPDERVIALIYYSKWALGVFTLVFLVSDTITNVRLRNLKRICSLIEKKCMPKTNLRRVATNGKLGAVNNTYNLVIPIEMEKIEPWDKDHVIMGKSENRLGLYSIVLKRWIVPDSFEEIKPYITIPAGALHVTPDINEIEDKSYKIYETIASGNSHYFDQYGNELNDECFSLFGDILK